MDCAYYNHIIQVIVASSHDNNPSKKILFDANSKETDSISLWGKYIAIASTNIRILDMDDSKEAQCGKNQVQIWY